MPGSTLTRCAGTAVLVCLAGLLLGCTSVDPGPDFTVPTFVFDENYFYCHVQPQFIFANNYKCGSGNGTSDPANGCHFNASAVSGMALNQNGLVDCGGGDAPVDPGSVAEGTPARSNYEAVSLEMSIDYTSAALFVRPSGSNHPRQIFSTTDANVNQILSKWAALSQ